VAPGGCRIRNHHLNSKNINLNSLGLIAGNGVYPLLVAKAARAAGIKRIVAAAFEKETDPALAQFVDDIEWMRVGQLGRLVSFFKGREVHGAIMAGQIDPRNLFDLRPDIKALIVLARLKTRNAETIFGAVGDELAKAGTKLLPATTFLEDCLATPGVIAGPKLSKREKQDVAYGFEIAKATSRLDVGQTVVVKSGTVLAVEAFEGTNEAIKRGGALGRKDSVVVKVSKPNQDFRFDVPVVGPHTLQTAREAKVRVVAVEAGRTLLLEREKIAEIADQSGISLVGQQP
jgi:DUF1009 family protein